MTYGSGTYSAGAYNSGGGTSLLAGPFLMILSGGPLDGEQQIVQALNTQIGTTIFFSLPHYQTFDASGDVVTDLGLEVEYLLVGNGPAPGPNDTWTYSWVFDFVPESYTPQPPALGPPATAAPPVATSFVSLVATSNLTVDGVDSLGVYLSAESTLEADGDTYRLVDDATVMMTAATTLTADSADFSAAALTVPLVGNSNMAIDGSDVPPINMLTVEDAGFEGGTTGYWASQGNGSVANSTAQAHSGSHSLACTVGVVAYSSFTTTGGPSRYPVQAGNGYHASFYARAATTPPSNCYQNILLLWFDAEMNVTASVGHTFNDTATGWTYVDCAGTAPAGSAYFALYLMVYNGNIGDVHYLDDAVVECTYVSGPNLMTGDDAFFEGGTLGHWGAYQACTIANDSTTGPNLLSANDSGFESGTVGSWGSNQGVTTLAVSTAQAHSGTHSLSMVASGGANTTAIMYLHSLPATRIYQFSLWYYSSTHAYTVVPQWGWQDSNNQPISYPTGSPVTIPIGQWTQVSATITAPANAVTMLVYSPTFSGTMPGAGEVFYVDDVSVTALGQAHVGTHSMQMICDGTNHPAAYNGFPPNIFAVTPNTAYTFSYWVYATTTRTALLNIWWLQANGSLAAALAPSVTATAGVWVQFSGTYISPPNAASVQIVPGISVNGNAGETIYWDDFAIHVR